MHRARNEERGLCFHVQGFASPISHHTKSTLQAFVSPFLSTLTTLHNSIRFSKGKLSWNNKRHLNLSILFIPVNQNLHFYTNQPFLLPVQCKHAHKVAISKTSHRTVESLNQRQYYNYPGVQEVTEEEPQEVLCGTQNAWHE